jgi:hypothetical protein
MSNPLKGADKQLQETTEALEQAVLRAAVEADESAGDDKRQAHKKTGSARGVETMFRTAYHVQMDLTGLADNKANMMISINGIIISIIIAAVAPKLDSNPWLLLPTMVFLLGTLVSIVYAILAARPRVSSVPITLRDLEHSQGNILFFGDFANLQEDDFVEGMLDLIDRRPLMYETMIRNIYGLGLVLRKKFALLQIAYTAFMLALVMGVLSFIAVFVWVLQQAPA